MNVKRTVQGYAQAGFACIMIEDQVMPKRCGHTQGKAVVSRDEALIRMQAAVDARNEGEDILIMARTDARTTDGLEEAIERSRNLSKSERTSASWKHPNQNKKWSNIVDQSKHLRWLT